MDWDDFRVFYFEYTLILSVPLLSWYIAILSDCYDVCLLMIEYWIFFFCFIPLFPPLTLLGYYVSAPDVGEIKKKTKRHTGICTFVLILWFYWLGKWLLWYFLSELWFSEVKYILISHFLWKNVGCWKKSTISNSKVMNTKFGQRLSLMVTSSSPTTNNGQYSLSAIFEQHKQNPQMPHFSHDQIFLNFWTLVRGMEDIWGNFDYERFFNNLKGKKRSIFIFDISISNHKNFTKNVANKRKFHFWGKNCFPAKQ